MKGQGARLSLCKPDWVMAAASAWMWSQRLFVFVLFFLTLEGVNYHSKDCHANTTTKTRVASSNSHLACELVPLVVFMYLYLPAFQVRVAVGDSSLLLLCLCDGL